jgi:hypothetical protein
VEERRFHVVSLVEWAIAALGMVALVWMVSLPVKRLTSPREERALAPADRLPPGVPAGAVGVPVLLLIDGREIHLGDQDAMVRTLLPDALAAGPPHVSASEFGERLTRAYRLDGSRFFIVFERLQPDGPMLVSGVYVP